MQQKYLKEKHLKKHLLIKKILLRINKENFTAQKFVKTPNIYLLAFDGMIPEKMAGKFLDLRGAETPAYITTLKQLNADIIPNAFSNSNMSYISFITMLALDLEWLYLSATNGLKDSLKPILDKTNPTYEIFHKNNYDIYYHVNSNLLEFINLRNHKNGKKPYFLLTYAGSAPNQAKHTEYHQKNTRDLAKFRQEFSARSKTAAKIIKRYVKNIRANDPDGIIIILGDHGTNVLYNTKFSNMVSFHWWKNETFQTLPPDSPHSRVDIIQDRQAVMLATLDPHGCQLRGEKLTTLNDMMLNLIECLTGGEPILKNRLDNQTKYIDYIYDPIE